jgi:hypothetical protein
MTPPCTRCGFDIETAEYVPSTQHMLLVDKHVQDAQGRWGTWQGGKFIRGGGRSGRGEPYWVCGHCHAPGEAIQKVVKQPGEGDE